MLPSSDIQKEAALQRIYEVTHIFSARTRLCALSMGILTLSKNDIDPVDCSPALATVLDGEGIKLLNKIIEDIARGERLTDDDILERILEAIARSGINEVLINDDAWRDLIKLSEQMNSPILRSAFVMGWQGFTGQLSLQNRPQEPLSAESAVLPINSPVETPPSIALQSRRLLRMPSKPYHIRIFLSSPGDVAYERALAFDVINQLPYDPPLRGYITLEAIAWDKPDAGTPLPAAKTPQEAINEALPKPSDCDIVVVIFWSRMGTPLPPEYAKPDGSRYLSGTEWEYEDAIRAFKQFNKPIVAVYRRKEKVLLDPDDSDFAEKLEQYKRVRNFFTSFGNPDGSLRQGYNTYETPEDFRRKFEHHLRDLVWHIIKPSPLASSRKQSKARGSTRLDIWQGSPFPGLRAFTPRDAPIFFGRGHETDELVRRLSDSLGNSFLAVVGASGSGKSSLVGAGLLARLQENAIPGSKDWIVVSFKPGEMGNDPFDALTMALMGDIPAFKIAPIEYARRKRELAMELRNYSSALADTCMAALMEAPEWARVLLFIDQFEELFSIAQDNYRKPFIQMLTYLAYMKRIHIVVTLRSDFYHRCVEWPQLAELLQEGSYPLAVPRLNALYEMITRPAARAALIFEEGLAEQILEDTGTDPGSLALMAYMLDELYHACEQERRLTHAAYKQLDGVQGAIGKRAENVFSALAPDARATLPYVFRDLVDVDERGIATRQRASLERLARMDAATNLVTALTNARLLVQSSGDDNQPVVEVAHEALLRSWPRLAEWIESKQDDLRLLRQVKAAALDWASHGKAQAFLWSDERLKPAYIMVEQLNPTLDDVVRDFIRPEIDRLFEELQKPATIHLRRREIGERLVLIGDTRPGLSLRQDNPGIPAIEWCSVPGDIISLQDDTHKFTVAPFYIAKYPITYLQFQAFIDDLDGYSKDDWWHGLARRETKPKPQAFEGSNHPRDTVTWFEAVAFCRWFTAKQRTVGVPEPEFRGEWEIRLPTEWEWQQAASGGNQNNIYPWGTVWDSSYANTDESKLGRTIAVGMYPHAMSPVGALDMSGNVSEWCLNKYDAPEDTTMVGHMTRARRGGSWLEDKDHTCIMTRDWGRPFDAYYEVGFRVCLATLTH